MEVLVQPVDGIKPILAAIEKTEKTLDLLIFRFDLKDVEKALAAAVKRGVAVRALIAHTNAGGENRLRKLELRLLEAGVTVSRTATDLVRYHGKMMILDREELHVYGFNFTKLDLRSRSFGVITRERKHVLEAIRLFEADDRRQEFKAGNPGLVVSPENAREQLANFIKRAKTRLSIYDEKITDLQMLRLLKERAKEGVSVRIIGKVGKLAGDLPVQKMPNMRLHLRAIIKDGDSAFVGSQSLRALELDARREVGLIVTDRKLVKRMTEVFDEDWSATSLGEKEKQNGKDKNGKKENGKNGKKENGKKKDDESDVHEVA